LQANDASENLDTQIFLTGNFAFELFHDIERSIPECSLNVPEKCQSEKRPIKMSSFLFCVEGLYFKTKT